MLRQHPGPDLGLGEPWRRAGTTPLSPGSTQPLVKTEERKGLLALCKGNTGPDGMKYKGIIFDLDGTLVDSFPGIHQSLARAMQAVGLPPWDLEKTRQQVGRGVDHLLETAVGTDKKAFALERFRADYAETCRRKTFLLPGVREGLDALRTEGLRLAVATNKPIPFTRLILDTLKIRTHFACLMAPDHVHPPKPHPAMLRAVCEELNLDPRDGLYVGDMPLDQETATRAHMDCLLVATGATPYESLKPLVTAPVVRTFSDIPPFLARASTIEP